MRGPLRCRIRVQGHLDSSWSEWFEGLTLSTLAAGETELAGELADQAAQHGGLATIRDLGVPLLAVAADPARATGVDGATGGG
jgi:hypothetical protein